jgi:hypothetical protein
MDKKKNHYEAELLALPPLRFLLSGAPSREMKEVIRLTPVHKPGEELEINVRKLIAHLIEVK